MISISVACPLFNEANNLEKLFKDLEYLHFFFLNLGLKSAFTLVNDASTDTSLSIIKATIQKYNYIDISLIDNPVNLGFANSAKLAFQKSKSDFLMILPGDAEVDVYTLSSFNPEKCDLVFFERVNMRSRPLSRILISHLYRAIISLIFLKEIEDYNGIFILKRSVYEKIGIDSDSFFINAEVIIKCRKIGSNVIKGTFSLHHKDVYKSTSLNIKQLFKISNNIWKLMKFKN